MRQLVGLQGQLPWDHADHTGTDEQWVQGNSIKREGHNFLCPC